jgi:hypothetical protein
MKIAVYVTHGRSSVTTVESLFKNVDDVVPQHQRRMAKSYKKLEGESQKQILRFLRDEGGIDHKTFFNKNPSIFGTADSDHRGRCEKFFHDTKRRVYSDPVKFRALLEKHGMAPNKTKKKAAKRHDSDDDDSDDDVEEVGPDDEPIAFVGSPNPKSKKQQPASQPKTAAKKKVTGNEKNGESSDEFCAADLHLSLVNRWLRQRLQVQGRKHPFAR